MCPACAAAHEPAERFCRDCGLPLVHAPGATAFEPLTEARERARKVRPQYAEGPLVRVAFARHQAEAELIQGLLLEEGVPSLVKRSRGFDVPDFLASGPRDIFAPASGAEVARDVLASTPAGGSIAGDGGGGGTPQWVQAMAVVVAVVLLAGSAAGVLAVLF